MTFLGVFVVGIMAGVVALAQFQGCAMDHRQDKAAAACREAAPEDLYRCTAEWFNSRGWQSPAQAEVLAKVREAAKAYKPGGLR